MPVPPELLSFTCPRCRSDVEERLYGPCRTCRGALGALGGAGSGEVVAAARFEPQMHVVPNHVATKE